MLKLLVIYSLVFCSGVVLSSYASSEYYECQNGVYETLYQTTEECRRSSYTPYMRTLRKRQNHVSGKDIADMLQNYCIVASDVAACVEGYINFLPCLRHELETFREMNRRSDWYCENSTARKVITDIYNSLPMQTLNYKTNKCYKDAPARAYPCIRRQLHAGTAGIDRNETMWRILNSFRCTYRNLYRKCKRDTSLLLTSLEYDWLLIPPALGINVSDTIIITSKIKMS